MKKCEHDNCTRTATSNNLEYHPDKWLCTYHANKKVIEGRRKRKYGNRKEMIFKKGDKVFDAAYGWGEVIRLISGNVPYHIKVSFSSGYEYYKDNGSLDPNGDPTLSFTEYTLEGFSQKRPLPFKVGDVVYLSDNQETWITCVLSKITNNIENTFYGKNTGYWKYLALKNPLKNPDTRIYTNDDL